MQNQEEREKIVNYGLIHIVDNDRNIKEIFNKKTYEPEFLDFYGIFSQSLGAYCRLYGRARSLKNGPERRRKGLWTTKWRRLMRLQKNPNGKCR